MSDYDSNFTIIEAHLWASCLDYGEQVIVQILPTESTQVQLSHLRSNMDSNFTIQAHLGASC